MTYHDPSSCPASPDSVGHRYLSSNSKLIQTCHDHQISWHIVTISTHVGKLKTAAQTCKCHHLGIRSILPVQVTVQSSMTPLLPVVRLWRTAFWSKVHTSQQCERHYKTHPWLDGLRRLPAASCAWISLPYLDGAGPGGRELCDDSRQHDPEAWDPKIPQGEQITTHNLLNLDYITMS